MNQKRWMKEGDCVKKTGLEPIETSGQDPCDQALYLTIPPNHDFFQLGLPNYTMIMRLGMTSSKLGHDMLDLRSSETEGLHF